MTWHDSRASMTLPDRANSFAQRRIVAELDTLQAEVDALKRLQAETAADPPSSDFGGTGLDALLPALLPSSPSYDETGDCGIKSEL